MTVLIGDWADRLCSPILLATQHLATLVRDPTEATIRQFERAMEAAKGEWLSLVVGSLTVSVGRGYERAWAPGIEPADWNAFFRMMIAFSGVISACGAWVSEHVGGKWGDHFFAASDFPLLRYDAIGCVLPASSAPILIPETTGDFAGSFLQVSEMCSSDTVRLQYQMDRAVGEMCSVVGSPGPSPSLGFRCWPRSDVETALGIGSDELDDAVTKRKIIAVESWSGHLEFPDFQFELGHKTVVAKWVLHVLERTPDSFQGWPLAIWLGQNRAKSMDFYAEKLMDRGLWTPSWGTLVADIFTKEEHCKDRKTIAADSVLWRVSPSAVTPFRFAQAVMPSAAGATAALRPSGRFDVDQDRSNLGSLYLSESPEGAWREVLDREPVVTLRHLTDRDSWRMSPKRDFVVVDLADSSPKVWTTPRRADTQDLATKYAIAGLDGLRAGLRTGGSHAVVLFGEGGKLFPSSAGIGTWTAERVIGLSGEAIWSYLASRLQDPDMATVLRRFPGEVRSMG